MNISRRNQRAHAGAGVPERMKQQECLSLIIPKTPPPPPAGNGGPVHP